MNVLSIYLNKLYIYDKLFLQFHHCFLYSLSLYLKWVINKKKFISLTLHCSRFSKAERFFGGRHHSPSAFLFPHTGLLNSVGTGSGLRQALFLSNPSDWKRIESAIKHDGSKCWLHSTEYAVGSHLSLCLFTWSTHFFPQSTVARKLVQTYSILVTVIAACSNTRLDHISTSSSSGNQIILADWALNL